MNEAEEGACSRSVGYCVVLSAQVTEGCGDRACPRYTGPLSPEEGTAACTWSCMFVWVSSSAFFSSDITQTFLFCRQRVAAARFRSRNFRRLSSGSSSTTLRRRPPVGWGGCIVCVGCICWVAGETCWEEGGGDRLGKEHVG